MDHFRSLNILGWVVPLWMVASAFILLGLLAYAPYFSSGFAADDFIFINMIEGATPHDPWLGLWAVPADQYRGKYKL